MFYNSRGSGRSFYLCSTTATKKPSSSGSILYYDGTVKGKVKYFQQWSCPRKNQIDLHFCFLLVFIWIVPKWNKLHECSFCSGTEDGAGYRWTMVKDSGDCQKKCDEGGASFLVYRNSPGKMCRCSRTCNTVTKDKDPKCVIDVWSKGKSYKSFRSTKQ